MTIIHPRPMSSAPLDGTPVRLFFCSGSATASFWSEERSRKAFGDGDYRAGWYLLDDDAIELDHPIGWEPLIHDRLKHETGPSAPEPVPPIGGSP